MVTSICCQEHIIAYATTSKCVVLLLFDEAHRTLFKIRSFNAHRDRINALALVGPWQIASVSSDGTALVYDCGMVASKPAILRPRLGPLYAIASDPSGLLVAVGGAQGVMQVAWPVFIGGCPIVHSHHKCLDGQVFDPAKPQQCLFAMTMPAQILALAIMPSQSAGLVLLAGCFDGTVATCRASKALQKHLRNGLAVNTTRERTLSQLYRPAASEAQRKHQYEPYAGLRLIKSKHFDYAQMAITRCSA